MSLKSGMALFLGVAVMAGLSGCGGTPVVGILLPTTGTANTYGESLESGIRVALSEARERNELPSGFEVVWLDTGSDPQQAVAKLDEAVRKRGAKMILGGATSDDARAMLPELQKLDVVCLSPSASAPDLTKKSKLFFRIYPSDELEGSRAGQFLYDTLNAKTVLVFVGDTAYSRGIEPEFRRQYEQSLGGKVVGDVSVQDSGWEATAADLLRREKPEAAYIIGYTEDIVKVLRQLHDDGFSGRIVTTSAFYSGKAIQDAGSLAEGVFFPLPPFDRTSDDEVVKRFVKRYMDTYQRAPDIFAAHGYDAMRLVIRVMTLAKPPETPEIKKVLHFGISEFKGVTGPILFDDYGDVKHYPKIFIVNDGRVVSYERFLKQQRARILRQVQDLLGEKR
jgi:branched-chain amino acid transport system substrate-binding protein